MTRAWKKAQERMFAEQAIRLLGQPWMLEGEDREGPDFQIRSPEEIFGLEVIQVAKGDRRRKGFPLLEKESLNARLITTLCERYYSAGGRPVSAHFLGSISAAVIDSLVDSMLRNCPEYPAESKKFEVNGMKVYLTALPLDWKNYSHWTYQDDRVGWVAGITTEQLQQQIDKKGIKLAEYKKRYERVDLLIVANRIMNSGKLELRHEPILKNPGFSNIYFFSYPEHIHPLRF